MPSFQVNNNQIVGQQSLGDLEHGFVNRDGAIFSNIGAVRLEELSSTDLTIYGVVHDYQVYAIYDDNVGVGADRFSLTVGAFGEVFGALAAVELKPRNTVLIDNRGEIASFGNAIIIQAQDGFLPGVSIVNSGSITTSGYAVVVLSADVVTIKNSGIILGNDAVSASLSSSLLLLNTGEISSSGIAVEGTGGDDTVESSGAISGDIILAGGDDTVSISGNYDGSLDGGTGNDSFVTTNVDGVFLVIGGSGNDILDTDSSDTILYELSNGGYDVVRSYAAEYTLEDNIEGLALARGAIEGNGNGESNLLLGNRRANLITGDAGNDTLTGNNGRDNLSGDQGNDTITGDNGWDQLFGGSNNDRLDGGDGDDSLWGERDADTLFGGAGDDTLRGGKGGDALTGGEGDDNILGGTGADVLNGGEGGDTLNGGLGTDTFYFAALTDSDGVEGFDLVQGFTPGQDKLHLGAIDANGALAGDPAFAFIGTAAFSAVGQVRYSVSGADLVVEVNTVGTSGAEMAIRVVGLAALGAGDFIL